MAFKLWSTCNRTQKIKDIFAPKISIINNQTVYGKKPNHPTGVLIGNTYYPDQTIIIHDTNFEKEIKGPKRTYDKMIEKRNEKNQYNKDMNEIRKK